MTSIDVIGIVAGVILAVVSLMTMFIEFYSSRRIKKNWDIIQHNSKKQGYELKQKNILTFYFESETRMSRELYSSEVFDFWVQCADDLDTHTLPKNETGE